MTRTSTANGRVSQSPAIARPKDRRGFVSKQDASRCSEVDGTQSIHRALHVLRLLASSAASGMRLVDIALGAHLHHSTTHRILRALEQEGIVERLVNSRRYTIGSEVVWLGLGASSRFPIATAAARALDRLSEQVGDAVFLSVHSGNDSICADRRIGSYPIQVLSIAIGSRRPLGVSQGGRVILAFLPPRVAQQVIAENADRYARHDLTPGAIVKNMNAARAQGHLCSDGVTVKGTRVVAVPILDVSGIAVAAISVIAVRHRLPANRVFAVIESLKAAAKEISQVLPMTAANRMRQKPSRL
jgi:DNA-binding IclR family transcriptional regulator